MNDPDCTANYLNGQSINTIVDFGGDYSGLRRWGNRTCASDILWAFESVRRTQDVVNDMLENAYLWMVDKPFGVQLLVDASKMATRALRFMKNQGALVGGSVWLDPERNTASQLQQGTGLARRFDAVAKPGNGKLLVVPRGGGTNAAGQAIDSMVVTPNDLTKFHFGGGNRPKHGVVTADHYDHDKALRVPKTAGSGDDPEHHLHHLHPDADHAQLAATAASKQFKRKEQRMTAETWGQPWIHAGALYWTQGFGDDDDRAWTMVTCEHLFGGKAGPGTHYEGEPKD